MSVISVELKLDQAAFFFVNDISVTKKPKVFNIDIADIRAIKTIIRGIIDNSVDSDTEVSVLKAYISGSSGNGGGGDTIPIPGPRGADGKSAYQLAIDNGYKGSLEDWLRSLKGEKGDKGETAIPSIDSLISKDAENAVIKGTDGKLFSRKEDTSDYLAYYILAKG